MDIDIEQGVDTFETGGYTFKVIQNGAWYLYKVKLGGTFRTLKSFHRDELPDHSDLMRMVLLKAA